MKINQLLDEFLVVVETEEYRNAGTHMIPTEMGKRLLRDFAAWCDERLTQRAADGDYCTHGSNVHATLRGKVLYCDECFRPRR